ncbi:hypothetical protein CAC42_903 [Sphaceloma murrayae]|uniref:Uncharacterized protein n=1 Tax=Sphaceloma murrayae TaxID=2082308 RepID=A0A2K1R2M5_9PEZI|nr:hypothetical protein CAC42_903 [Sphaceloma murrayae]
MADDWNRPRRGDGRKEVRARSMDRDGYDRVYERQDRGREYYDDSRDYRRLARERDEKSLILSPVHTRQAESRRYEDRELAAVPYRDGRGRQQQLIIYDDSDEYSDDSRSRSRKRYHDRSSHKDKSKKIPTGRCWYSQKERKDADFLERNFDSSYDGLIAAAAGAALGAMTANRFSKEEHRHRNIAGSAIAGAIAFNFAENSYSRFIEDDELIEAAKDKVKEKVKDKIRI